MRPAPVENRPLVLVVDDYDDAREMCREILSFAGFRVASASDGLQAVELALDLLPDLILMDLAMPMIDGIEATRRIKSDARMKETPILALTGYSEEIDTADAIEAGCQEILVKPCMPDALLAAVRRVLAVSRRA